MIVIAISVTLKDTMVATWLSTTRTLPMILLNLIFPLTGIFLLCAEFFIKDSSSYSVVMIAISSIFFTPLIGSLNYYSLKWRNPAALQQIYHVDETSIRQIGENFSIDIQWDMFDKIKETKSYFLSFPKNKTGNVGVIPKRSLSEQDTIKLRELFARKINLKTA